MALRTESLASYRVRFLREVKDSEQQLFNAQGQAPGSQASYLDIDAWINEAIAWRDLYSKGSRSYRQAVPLQAAIDQYDLTALFPQDTVLDIATLWLLWGSWRVRLDERPFSEVTDVWRPWVNYVNVPGAYCRYGANGIFIATAGSAGYTVDWDVVTLSVQFASDAPAVADPLPYPYTEPVVKYAAYLGLENGLQQYDKAEKKKNEALGAMADIEGSRVGQLPQQYFSSRGNQR